MRTADVKRVLEETRPTGHGRARGLVSSRESGRRIEARTFAPGAELAQLATQMEATYAKGRYCVKTAPGKGERCLTLDEMGKQMAERRDFDELLELWSGWHSISPSMRPGYARFVELAPVNIGGVLVDEARDCLEGARADLQGVGAAAAVAVRHLGGGHADRAVRVREDLALIVGRDVALPEGAVSEVGSHRRLLHRRSRFSG